MKCPGCSNTDVSLGSRVASRFGRKIVCARCGRRLRAEKKGLTVAMYGVVSALMVPISLWLFPYAGCMGVIAVPVALVILGEVVLGVVCPVEVQPERS